MKCVLLLVPSFGCLSFTVQSLTLEGCFHIHLLKVESFFVLIGTVSIVCDITANLESNVVQYVSSTCVMWKLETSSAQTLSGLVCNRYIFEMEKLLYIHRYSIFQWGRSCRCYFKIFFFFLTFLCAQIQSIYALKYV